jgi:hypothetical protein
VITTKIMYDPRAPAADQKQLVGLVPKTFLPECVRLAYYQSVDTQTEGTLLDTHSLLIAGCSMPNDQRSLAADC